MVIGFDWDGTLVQSWTSTPLPGVRERLGELPEGTKTFITHCGREDGARAYHEVVAANRFGRLISHVAWFGPMCHGAYAKPNYRKPDIGMLYTAPGHFGEAFADMLYIGDMETDRQAAVAAGCRYLDAAAWREGGLNE